MKETYKATPKGWDESHSYLVVIKIITKLSSGKILERYEVVKRWSRQGHGEPGKFTNSLKGVHYIENELKDITLM